MTAKELIKLLQQVPEDAEVLYTSSRFIVDGFTYDDFDNTILLDGTNEFEEEYYNFCDEVDETNYDPYIGCDSFETADGFVDWGTQSILC